MAFFKDIFKKLKPNDLKSKKSYAYLNQVDPMTIWEIVGEIGDGAFGKVYKGKNRETGDIAALKQVELEEEGDLEEYIIEIEILTECKHTNIINMYAAYNFEGKLWMSLEYCNGGALDSLMIDLDKGLNESAIKYVGKEVLNGLIFLHELNIIHRDMKAGNVLLSKEADVKLADFGVSAKMTNDKQKRNTQQGTPYWMAPEVICCQNMDIYYDCRADIWSYGITLIELAQMRPPYHQMQPNRVLLKIPKSEPPTLEKPKMWSNEFQSFLATCLVKDADKRPFGPDLLNDPFVKNVSEANKKALKVLIYEAKAENIQETVEDVDMKNIRQSLIPNGDLDATAREVYLEADDNSSVGSSDIISANEKPTAVGRSLKDTIAVEILTEIVDQQLKSETDPLSVPAAVFSAMEELNPCTSIDDTVKEISKKPPAPYVSRQDSVRMAMEEAELANEPDIIEEPAEKNGDAINSVKPDGPAKAGVKIDRKKSHYKTMTRTKKFVVDGEEIITVDKRVVREGHENKNVEEINNRKEVLREMKILGKDESRQKRAMIIKVDSEKNELINRLKTEEITMERNFDTDMDKLSKDQKMKLEKIENQNFLDMKNYDKKHRTDKINKENEYRSKEKAQIQKEVDKLNKNEKKRTKENLNMILQDKMQTFSSKLEQKINDELDTLTKEHRKQLADVELQMLEDKCSRKRKHDDDMSTKNIGDCQSIYQQEKQHNKDFFMLKRQQMKNRQDKEIELLEKENKKEQDELENIHQAERRTIPRTIKTVSQTRLSMKKEELKILLEKNQITQAEMRKRIKQFTDSEREREKKDHQRKEMKLKKIREDLLKDHFQRRRENDQIHAEQKKDLTDQETASTKELEKKHKEKIRELEDISENKKIMTEDQFIIDRDRIRQFYSVHETANGTITPYSDINLCNNGVSQPAEKRC